MIRPTSRTKLNSVANIVKNHAPKTVPNLNVGPPPLKVIPHDANPQWASLAPLISCLLDST